MPPEHGVVSSNLTGRATFLNNETSAMKYRAAWKAMKIRWPEGSALPRSACLPEPSKRGAMSEAPSAERRTSSDCQRADLCRGELRVSDSVVKRLIREAFCRRHMLSCSAPKLLTALCILWRYYHRRSS